MIQYHELGDLKQWELFLTWFWRMEIQGNGKAMPPWKIYGQRLPCFFLASSRCQQLSPFLGSRPRSSRICHHLHMAVLLLGVPVSTTAMLHVGVNTHPVQPCLNLITSQRAYFQISHIYRFQMDTSFLGESVPPWKDTLKNLKHVVTEVKHKRRHGRLCLRQNPTFFLNLNI